MAKGTYLGGGTIVQPGSPLLSYSDPPFRSRSKRHPQAISTPRNEPDPAGIEFVRSAVRAWLRSNMTPVPPGRETPLGRKIARAESVYLWIIKHPHYGRIREEEQMLLEQERRRPAMEA